MNRRGFFSAIASAVAAGIVIPRESIIIQPPPLFSIDYGILDTTVLALRYHTPPDETGIHIRYIRHYDPPWPTRNEISGHWVTRCEKITHAEFKRRYPDSTPIPIASE